MITTQNSTAPITNAIRPDAEEQGEALDKMIKSEKSALVQDKRREAGIQSDRPYTVLSPHQDRTAKLSSDEDVVIGAMPSDAGIVNYLVPHEGALEEEEALETPVGDSEVDRNDDGTVTQNEIDKALEPTEIDEMEDSTPVETRDRDTETAIEVLSKPVVVDANKDGNISKKEAKLAVRDAFDALRALIRVAGSIEK